MHFRDDYHVCNDSCTFNDAFNDGRFIVCMRSLKVHACRGFQSGKDACVIRDTGYQEVCILSGRVIFDQVMKHNFIPTQTRRHIGIKVQIRDAQMARLWRRLGQILYVLFEPKLRRRYNEQAENAVAFYLEVFERVTQRVDRRNAIPIELTLAMAESRRYLLPRPVRLSRITRLEKVCKTITKAALSSLKRPKDVDFLCTNASETCVYVLRCVLNGYATEGEALLNWKEFGDLGPMPSDRGLKNTFSIEMRRITTCSQLLQRAFNNRHCRAHIRKSFRYGLFQY